MPPTELLALGAGDKSLFLNAAAQFAPFLRLLVVAAAGTFSFDENSAGAAVQSAGGDQILIGLIFHAMKGDYLRKTMIAPYPYSANEAS